MNDVKQFEIFFCDKRVQAKRPALMTAYGGISTVL